MRNIKSPEYDPLKEPFYDINTIKSKLNHRSPFLLVDKIMDIVDNEIFGIKCVSFNEPYFTGHFPQEPVMPGVLIIEALGQCGGLLVLSKFEDPEKYSTYFVKVESFKFKRKVVPGDTLKLVLQLDGPVKHSIVRMKARAFVGDKVAAEGILIAQVIKNK